MAFPSPDGGFAGLAEFVAGLAPQGRTCRPVFRSVASSDRCSPSWRPKRPANGRASSIRAASEADYSHSTRRPFDGRLTVHRIPPRDGPRGRQSRRWLASSASFMAPLLRPGSPPGCGGRPGRCSAATGRPAAWPRGACPTSSRSCGNFRPAKKASRPRQSSPTARFSSGRSMEIFTPST